MIQSVEELNQTVLRLQAQLGDAQNQIDDLHNWREREVQPALDNIAVGTLGPLVNLLPDSDVNYSVDAANTDPASYPAGGDISFEAWQWYRFLEGTTALAEDSAHALKAVGHSLYAANEGANDDIPIWDKVNGIIRMGGTVENWFLATPFIVNHGRPSGELVFQAIIELLSATAFPTDVGLAVGIWDNTAGQRKWLEGGNIALSYSVVGPGSTSAQYFVVATTDYGHQYKSDVLTVATAPASPDASHYVDLRWTKVVGVTSYDVYRKVAGVTVLVGQIRNGAVALWDQGQSVKTVSDFPTVTDTAPLAYVEIPASRFAPNSTEWKQFVASIIVPFNYNSGLTTDKQWLIIKLTGLITEARQVQVDHLGLGEQFGAWARSYYDSRVKNNVSTTTSSSTQGTVGTGTGTGPGGGTGGELCPDVDAMVTLVDGTERRAGDIRPGDRLMSPDAPFAVVEAVRRARVVDPWLLVTRDGKRLRMSGSEPVRAALTDHIGKQVRDMVAGDGVLTLDGETRAEMVCRIADEFDVAHIMLRVPFHFYYAGGIAIHNRKLDGDPWVYTI